MPATADPRLDAPCQIHKLFGQHSGCLSEPHFAAGPICGCFHPGQRAVLAAPKRFGRDVCMIRYRRLFPRQLCDVDQVWRARFQRSVASKQRCTAEAMYRLTRAMPPSKWSRGRAVLHRLMPAMNGRVAMKTGPMRCLCHRAGKSGDCGQTPTAAPAHPRRYCALLVVWCVDADIRHKKAAERGCKRMAGSNGSSIWTRLL